MKISKEGDFYVAENSRTNLPEDHWIDRALGIPKAHTRKFQMHGNTAYGVANNTLWFTRSLSNCQKIALSSVMRDPDCDRHPDYQHNDGVGIFLSDPTASRFLLTKKDDKHPNPKCRGMLSMLGGCREPHESMEQTRFRELFEEIDSTDLVNEIEETCLSACDSFPSVQWPGTYRCSHSIAIARTQEQFERWMDAWLAHPSVVLEGIPVVLEREPFYNLLSVDESTTCFVGSHGKMMHKLLSSL